MKLDDYSCTGQMTLDNLAEEVKPLEYGSRGCKACAWWNRRKPIYSLLKKDGDENERDCNWNDPYWKNLYKQPLVYPTCESFMPNDSKIPGMCQSCKWSNQFEYETKPEYDEELKKHNGYTRRSADDPLEEPNIYCTHPEGSLNRRTAYKDCEQEGFGVGHWDRQHQWDTCDRWKEDRGKYAWWDFGGKE